MKKSCVTIVGIDEAGRGPLSGPLSMGLVAFSNNHGLSFSGLKDSKKLSSKKREDWFKKINLWQKEGKLIFSHIFISPHVIDTKGLAWALRRAVELVVKKSGIRVRGTKIFLDAGLRAPRQFNQKSIVKGDEKIPTISLASIVAKVKRDRYMVRIAKKYPQYGFEIHKGYGTVLHRKFIKKHGVTAMHRKSFLNSLY